MSNETIPRLLSDAYLVLEYAVRVGRLPNDDLPNAIKACEDDSEDNQLTHLAPLSYAMNEAIAAISPASLDDLRSGRTPFDERFVATSQRIQYGLCFLVVVIASLIAFYSYALQREEAALREYEQIQKAQIQEKIVALRKLVKDDNALQLKDSRYELYQRSLIEIKDLEARSIAILAVLEQLVGETKYPFQEMIDSLLHGSATDSSSMPQAENWGSVCKDLANEEKAAHDGRMTYIEQISLEKKGEFCFMLALNFRNERGTYNYISQAGAIGKLQNRMILQSVWILPFFSGLLGAAVFILRESLDVASSFGFSRTIVRLAIGGVSGIIIGWFWSPSSALGSELKSVSSIPLALAFVTGYSIDILYSVLERIRRTVAMAQEPPRDSKGAQSAEPRRG